MTFEEFSELSGQGSRKVEFDVLKADIVCLGELPDFTDFDPTRETLTMLKLIYGLKDAPSAWRKKLHQVFIQWMSCRPLRSEPELYCVHRKDNVVCEDIHRRAQQHVVEQQEVGVRDADTQAYEEGNLSVCSVSASMTSKVARGERLPSRCLSISTRLSASARQLTRRSCTQAFNTSIVPVLCIHTSTFTSTASPPSMQVRSPDNRRRPNAVWSFMMRTDLSSAPSHGRR